MANNLVSNPWILDTSSASPVKTGRTWVMGFVFFGYTTATDKFTVKDYRGITIFEMAGTTDLAPVSITFQEAIPIKDLTISALEGSGKLQVVIE